MAVLVSSSDGYADLWGPFFTLFFRYWPDCPYPVYLATNHTAYAFPRVVTISGRSEDWSENMKIVLQKMEEPYVLLMLEDYLLQKPVRTREIEQLLWAVHRRNAVHCRLLPAPPADAPSSEPGLGRLSPQAPYRVSIQAGIWKKEVLGSLLRPGESPWQFEIEGTRRARKLPEEFLCVLDRANLPIHYFCTGIIRGKWVRGAIELLKKEGIEPDLRRRAVESWRDEARRFVDTRLVRKEAWIWAAKRTASRLGLTRRRPAASEDVLHQPSHE